MFKAGDEVIYIVRSKYYGMTGIIRFLHEEGRYKGKYNVIYNCDLTQSIFDVNEFEDNEFYRNIRKLTKLEKALK